MSQVLTIAAAKGYLLKEANKADIYTPVDYSRNPVNYCGILINKTPYPF